MGSVDFCIFIQPVISRGVGVQRQFRLLIEGQKALAPNLQYNAGTWLSFML